MKLAEERTAGQWVVHPDSEPILRAMGERNDMVRTMQRAIGGTTREIAMMDPRKHPGRIVGSVLARGMTDEQGDRSYLALDGIDGKAYFVPFRSGTELDAPPLGAVVEVRGAREIDKSITAQVKDGIYRASHLKLLTAHPSRGRSPADLVQLHVRRLEALRRAGIVERLEDGVWQVPTDLPSQGVKYDVGRRGRLVVQVASTARTTNWSHRRSRK